MNKENQNIEWKESWRDEYLKWICGFANAQGGQIYIGKNDQGEVVGITDSAKLLEDIPNKVRDVLGILVNVNALSENEKVYLEIEVEAYPYPISYKGQYHYRTGSTKQELKGAALDKFLLQKLGKRWDGVPVPRLTENDLSRSALDYFRKKAVKSKRLDADIWEDSMMELLEKLQLVEDVYLKRATILLFHPNPEKYITGAFIKIGFFRTDIDLDFQDEIHGHLFEQVEKTMELLLTKYLKAYIRYERLHRIEEYPIPETALREAILNAVAHKDYSGQTPIQISVYENRLLIWNQGQLPEHWTIEKLSQKHPSAPYNPAIANVFFKAGLIEAWGRGTLRILDDCRLAKTPIPVFQYDFGGFMVDFKMKQRARTDNTNGIVNGTVNDTVKAQKLLPIIRENPAVTLDQMATQLAISKRTINRYILILKASNQLIRKGSDKLGTWEIMDIH
jgi:ATP-dependent DNA helicase RecG